MTAFDEETPFTPNENEEMQTTPEPPAEVAASAEAEDEVLAGLVVELTAAKRTADEANDRALRAQAELANFRRRKEREAEERVATANGRLLKELLPVVDDFELAFAAIPETGEGETNAWAKGFELILRKLQSVVEREGITPINATGVFDPNVHEAISVEPSDTVPSGEIIAEVRRGYRLHDKILRPSYVRVAL